MKRLAVLVSVGILMLTAPLVVSAQDEPEPIPFTQIVTSDGLITLAYPSEWSLDDTSFTDAIVFRSDPLAEVPVEGAVIVTLSFLQQGSLNAAFLTGETLQENMELLRETYTELIADADGQPVAEIGDIEVIPATADFPEIASVSIEAPDQIATFLMWEIADGLFGTLWTLADTETWAAEEANVLEIARSVRYAGDPELLQAMGANS